MDKIVLDQYSVCCRLKVYWQCHIAKLTISYINISIRICFYSGCIMPICPLIQSHKRTVFDRKIVIVLNEYELFVVSMNDLFYRWTYERAVPYHVAGAVRRIIRTFHIYSPQFCSIVGLYGELVKGDIALE